jgi:hypothetical protein
MTRKLMVLGLAIVLVIAVAIPVVAQERVVAPKLQKVSKRALAKSRTALKTSRVAKRQARSAEEAAQVASGAADQAAGAAGRAAAEAAAAQAAIDSTRVRSAVAAGSVTTGSPEFVPLEGGPSVQVTVPSSGLIEVWAQATISGEGAVSLFEDGQPMPGQVDFCSPDEDAGVLFSVGGELGEPITMSTPAGGGVGLCGSLGAPAPVLFETTPGTHTYELRYASCGCEDPAEAASFTDRRLFVGPRL